ncbi:MAG TPA: acetate--CoA ligase family protein, partial [Actinomycetota bacterium]|nr:acetate--CoA ligase family protein [Actinomycetota bacterium]
AGDDLEPGYARVAERVWGETDLPLAVLCNMASAIGPESAEQLRAAGVPVLEGTDTGLAAFRILFALRDHRDLPAPQAPSLPPDEVRERWRARLGLSDPWTEAEGLRLLADYGLPVVEFREATTEDQAVAAASELGYPVVLKTATPDGGHKSDRDGVRLTLSSEEAVREAHRDLAERLGPDVLVARQVPEGVELALGVVRDEQFGPLVLVAAGGVLVEVLDDRRLALPPLGAAGARRLVDGLAARSLLDGVRGRPPVDVAAVVEALVRLSALASDLGDALDALDVNPLIAGPNGCVAADALVIPRRDAGTP